MGREVGLWEREQSIGGRVGIWLDEADLAMLGPHDLCRVTRRSRIPAPQGQETSREGHLVTRDNGGAVEAGSGPGL